MKKPNTLTVLYSSVVVILAGALIAVLVFMKNQPPAPRGMEPLVQISSMEPDSSVWGINFPNQYSTFLKTETNDQRTAFGGSQPFSKLEDDPRLLVLFAGYGFSKEYNEDRGHVNALYDVQNIARINEKSPATCYSCKSSTNPKLWNEMGMEAYDKTLFSEMTQHVTTPIGCANCHDAETMQLIVTNPALEEALEKQGKDWKTFTRQEMRTVVCANCHVEYYFEGPGAYLVFPWEKGTRIEEIISYYADEGFSDWKHPDSGTPMLKAQHPEYEFFTADSTHFKAGVSCADCHMPYTRDGAAKFSTHDVKSPLLNPQVACGACHTNVEYVTGRVAVIQSQVRATMISSEEALLAAIGAIQSAAADPKVDAALLDEARRMHRESQMRWDFIAAENSMGFHNPEEALRILADSTDLARQAQLKALEATGVTIPAAKRP